MGESHLRAIKTILKYLKRTITVGLWYTRCDNLKLIGYLNLDYTCNKLNKKRTIEGVNTIS